MEIGRKKKKKILYTLFMKHAKDFRRKGENFVGHPSIDSILRTLERMERK